MQKDLQTLLTRKFLIKLAIRVIRLGQRLKLVCRGDREAILEITATEARCPVLLQGQRPHYPAANEQTGQHSHAKANQ